MVNQKKYNEINLREKVRNETFKEKKVKSLLDRTKKNFLILQ